MRIKIKQKIPKSEWEVILDEEEVAFDAIPLAVKSPMFSLMVKSFSREDLEDLYNITAALIDVNAAQSKLVLLENFNKNYSNEVEPKKVRKNNDAPIIEDWVSDDEDEVESLSGKEDKSVIHTAAKIEKNKLEPISKILMEVMLLSGGGEAYGGRITCKATYEESMLWHRRLGHINFKNINKLVKENLVRDLPLKRFKNDKHVLPILKASNTELLKKVLKENIEVVGLLSQNGVAERRNRTLIEAARTMLVDSKLPTIFWAEAVSTACYVP
ncbi:ribonuclease H-like domain-containing protein [Tanacetum coccineum]